MAGSKYPDRTLSNDLFDYAVGLTPSDEDSFEGPVHVIPFDGTVITVTTTSGQVVEHPVIPGLMLPVRVTKVHATGTDCTQVMGYWS